jgi:hypothetical protein
MKYVHLNALFLMFVFHTSCRQNQTNSPKDPIKSETKAIDTSWGADIMVRNIKKGRNGTILIASSKGVFRYDRTTAVCQNTGSRTYMGQR